MYIYSFFKNIPIRYIYFEDGKCVFFVGDIVFRFFHCKKIRISRHLYKLCNFIYGYLSDLFACININLSRGVFHVFLAGSDLSLVLPAVFSFWAGCRIFTCFQARRCFIPLNMGSVVVAKKADDVCDNAVFTDSCLVYIKQSAFGALSSVYVVLEFA